MFPLKTLITVQAPVAGHESLRMEQLSKEIVQSF